MKTLMAFLGGAAIGAAAALLLSAENGPQNRKRLAQFLRDKGIIPPDFALGDSPEDDEELDVLMAEVVGAFDSQPAPEAPKAEAPAEKPAKPASKPADKPAKA
ncbi:MAG: hypothetical protein UHP27_05495 [Muribaculaceae bacterium]|nr:hypothetical protein [Muribaculaceae bacterium]